MGLFRQGVGLYDLSDSSSSIGRSKKCRLPSRVPEKYTDGTTKEPILDQIQKKCQLRALSKRDLAKVLDTLQIILWHSNQVGSNSISQTAIVPNPYRLNIERPFCY